MAGIPNKEPSSVLSSLDITAISPLPYSQLLNNYSVKYDTFVIEKLRNEVDRPEFWHRFMVITNPKCKKEYTKSTILKHLAEFVYPHQLLPVYSLEKEGKVYFLARNCLDAIVKLCVARLVVPNPLEHEYPFCVIIIKDITTTRTIPLLNPEKNLIEVLKKRESRGLLNLSKFYEDEGLQQFYPLFQPNVLFYVFSVIPNFELQINRKVTKLVLSHNNIMKLPEALKNSNLQSIDLSHNKLQNIEDLIPLKGLPQLQWVKLEGNPLCCRFDSEITYFLYVKAICPSLQTLDTKRLCEDGWYKKHRTFLCEAEGFDFANQFIQQFFTYFDELGRPNISSFYHENAQFSMTHNFQPVPGKTLDNHYPKFTHEHLNKFIYLNRNLFISKTMHGSLLFDGQRVIGRHLQENMPATCHHPLTFYVDLMQYTKCQAIISVTGVFRDEPRNAVQEKIVFGFQRTFLLITKSKKDPKEWLILNDMWHVYSPFKYAAALPLWPARKVLPTFPDFHPKRNNETDMEALVQAFASITDLEYGYSKKFLEKSNWDLRLSLEVFMDEHINNEIPKEVFLNNNEINQDVIINCDSDSDNDNVIVSEDVALPSILALSSSIPVNVKPTTSAKTYMKNWTSDAHAKESVLFKQPAHTTDVPVIQNGAQAKESVLFKQTADPTDIPVLQNATVTNANVSSSRRRRKSKRARQKDKKNQAIIKL